MFDGSHRTQRRSVNLGSKKHKSACTATTVNDKSALLEQTRIRREERRIAAANTAAALRIQRIYRGHTSRCQTALRWEGQIQEQLMLQSPQVDRVTPLLNALFGIISVRRQQQAVYSLLQQYAVYIDHLSGPVLSHPPPQAHRIVGATLQQITEKQRPSLTSEQVVIILSYTLDFSMGEAAHEPSSYYWHRAGGIVLLVDTYCSISMGDTALKDFLYLCVQTCLPDTLEGRALQCALSLANDTSASGIPAMQHLSSLLQVLRSSNTNSRKESKDLLAGTMQRLVSQNAVRILYAVTHSCPLDVMSIAARIQFVKIVLLDSDINSRLPLLWLLNCVMRGDTVTTTDATTTVDDGMDIDVDNESDEEEDRAHAKTMPTSTIKNVSHHRSSKYDLQTVPKLDRLFSSHVQKVDQWYKANLQHHQLQMLATTLGDADMWLLWGNILFTPKNGHDESATDDGLILQQAREDYVTVLTTLLQATTGLRPRSNASSSQLLNKLAFAPLFVSSLWRFVVGETEKAKLLAEPIYAMDFKLPSASKTILYLSFSLFSDLFAHYLIALKDDQFLSSHTAMSAFDGGPAILAEDVITHLRTLLYELYWTKPVLAADVKLILGACEDAAFSGQSITASSDEERLLSSRARLLLTGTKLWNSLYERWCRLVRHAPFCNEATWCFPTMSNLSPDNAVLANDSISPANERRQAGRHFDEDAMVIDDTSSDSDVDDVDGVHLVADAESDQLAAVISDPKMARLLASIPQALPFDRRVKLFDSLLRADKIKTQDETTEMHQAMLAMMRGRDGDISGREKVEIRRDELYVDSMRQLSQLGPKLKRRIQVSFINKHGAHEAGIDGGGVFKEFIDDLIKDAFSIGDESTSSRRFFSVTPLQTLTVNTDMLFDQSLLSHYEFLGRVLGKAVYESILVEPQFCLPFLNQLLGKSNSMEDLKNFDFEYYRNLTKLLTLSVTELESMGLAFELTVGSGFTSHTVELMPGGRNVSVTKHNVVQYIYLVSHLRLNVQSARQTRAFLRGFRDLIPASWVRLFCAYELQKIISGDDSVQGIDICSLKRVMQYAAGYHPDQPVIQWFWEIVNEMTVDQQHKLLKFMTSCSRQPLLGFESLEPAPCLQQIRLPDAIFELNDKEKVLKQTPLPTSSTCMNLLKLPNYRWKELMRSKLLAAIESGAGFELT